MGFKSMVSSLVSVFNNPDKFNGSIKAAVYSKVFFSLFKEQTAG